VILLFVFAIFFALVMFLALLANITQIPWDLTTGMMFTVFVLGCLTVRRRPRIGAFLLFYAALMAEMTINRIPPNPDEYKTVPPSNTLVIPRKD
jgi:hypothetical protein